MINPPCPHPKRGALRPPPGSPGSELRSCMCSRRLVSFWPYDKAMTLTIVRILWSFSPCKLKLNKSSILYDTDIDLLYTCKNLWGEISTCEDFTNPRPWRVAENEWNENEMLIHLQFIFWRIQDQAKRRCFPADTIFKNGSPHSAIRLGAPQFRKANTGNNFAPEDTIHHNLRYLDPCVHYLGWSNFSPQKNTHRVPFIWATMVGKNSW